MTMTTLRRILPYLLAVYFSIAGYGHAQAQSYNRFQPANGVLVGNTATYVTTAAASSDIRGLWSGTCNASSFLRGDGACAVPSGTGVTSVALTVPSGLSVSGSPITSTGTLAISTTLSGVVKANGSGFTASAVNLATADVTGTLPVASGGIGAATLTGIAKGNGTSAFTAAASSDVIGTWSGTCNNTTFLRGDGTCAAGAGGSGGNPTATIGLTAVNGVAASFIRSDGAPALSQAIVPTWTGLHTFTASATTPIVLNASTAGVNQKNTIVRVAAVGSSGAFGVSSATDAAPSTIVTDALNFTRAGTAWGGLSFGNATDNPAYAFLGTGLLTTNGRPVVSTSAGTGKLVFGTIVVSGASCVVSNGSGYTGTCTYNGAGSYSLPLSGTTLNNNAICTASTVPTNTSRTFAGAESSSTSTLVTVWSDLGIATDSRTNVICVSL